MSGGSDRCRAMRQAGARGLPTAGRGDLFPAETVIHALPGAAGVRLELPLSAPAQPRSGKTKPVRDWIGTAYFHGLRSVVAKTLPLSASAANSCYQASSFDSSHRVSHPMARTL